MMPKSVESVFIFQEGSEGEPNTAATTYDAIVVEQWTIIDVSEESLLLSSLQCSPATGGEDGGVLGREAAPVFPGRCRFK